MTDRSDLDGPENGGPIVLGPAARRQLEAIVSQVGVGLLAVAIEGAGGDPARPGWTLSIERATLELRPVDPPGNGAAYPLPSPSLNAPG